MPATAIIGLQWGDEGKGGVVDLLAEDLDVVVRYQGGANAGHTVVAEGREYIFHQVPSGVLHSRVEGILASGMVIDPEALSAELEELERGGVQLQGRVFVSDRAHVVLPYHKRFEEVVENTLGEASVGTTRRGIGPAYADKALRVGLRMADLLEPSSLERRITTSLGVKAFSDKALPEELACASLAAQCRQAGERLRPFMTDTGARLMDHLEGEREVLLEGAQGALLDIDHGTYPFATSSSCGAAGACVGSGVPPSRLSGVIGVAKAYTTRVGNGPFPTELPPDEAELFRCRGNEYGATTRRPRRCGWFDAVAMAYAARLNGVDKLVVTKLDVLSGMPTLKLCTAYQENAQILDRVPASAEALSRSAPVYEEMEGWENDIAAVRAPEHLPSAALRYLHRIEELVETPLWMVSVGPQRDQFIHF